MRVLILGMRGNVSFKSTFEENIGDVLCHVVENKNSSFLKKLNQHSVPKRGFEAA